MQEHIIRLLKVQDPVAIAHIYDTYGAAVYGAVLRIVINKELAQQVMQDTFLKVWRYGAHYDESKGQVFTWVLNIARNTAIDATRTPHFRNSKKTVNLDSLAHTAGDDTINSDSIGMNEVVQKMEEKHKVLIDLIYMKGYTHQEASDATGMPIGTVKTRVRSAILELRKTFDV